MTGDWRQHEPAYDKTDLQTALSILASAGQPSGDWEPVKVKISAFRLAEEIAFALKATRMDALVDISGITLGDEIAGKITEDQAVRLVNSVLSAKRSFDRRQK